MTLMEQMVHSPRLPQYVRELSDVLSIEKANRRRFFDEVREDQKAEFINGMVIVQLPVKLEHDNASMNLAILLKTYVQTHSLGYVGHEKMLISLTRNDYEPDICYFGQAKAAALKPRQMRFPAPDLIVEVISPSTEKIDRTIKFEDYAAHSVDEYWIVDPRKKTIEQYLLATDRYAVAAKSRGGKLKSRAIKGLEIPVRAAFDAGENLRALARIIGPPSKR